jgi:hypothetical protein
MSTRTRVGKIARLPKWIREELNTRLENGEQGNTLLEWLNGSPEVKDVLAEQFDGSPISENNLSAWKQGGHQDWLKSAAACDLVRDLAERSRDLDEAARETPIGDELANVLAVELIQVVEMLLSQEGSVEERWSRLQQALQTVSRLRRDDHAAVKTAMKKRRADIEIQMMLHRGRKENPML